MSTVKTLSDRPHISEYAVHHHARISFNNHYLSPARCLKRGWQNKKELAISAARILHLNGNDGLHPVPFTSCYITGDNTSICIDCIGKCSRGYPTTMRPLRTYAVFECSYVADERILLTINVAHRPLDALLNAC